MARVLNTPDAIFAHYGQRISKSQMHWRTCAKRSHTAIADLRNKLVKKEEENTCLSEGGALTYLGSQDEERRLTKAEESNGS
jgi:hypothetical protein